MEKMLVTQGLNELKTISSRIERAIGNAKFVAAAKKSEKNVAPSLTKDEFIEKAKASFQSIEDLINRREKIKAAIVQSNAETLVEVCGETMTVAKAIELKSFIEFRKMLLDQMRDQLYRSTATMNNNNSMMETKIDSLVATAFGKESKTNVKPEDYSSIADPYRNANEWALVDPLKIEDKIHQEEEYINEFVSTVDSVLQISNCVTFIEF